MDRRVGERRKTDRRKADRRSGENDNRPWIISRLSIGSFLNPEEKEDILTLIDQINNLMILQGRRIAAL